MCCTAAQSLAVATPGAPRGSAGEVFLCAPQSGLRLRLSFQGPSSEDRSFSDAGFQVLQDLEPSSTTRRGVFRKCSAPASVGCKVQQNAAFSQKEPPSVGRDAECQSRWSAICCCKQHLTWQGELWCPGELPAATLPGRAVLSAALRALRRLPCPGHTPGT